MQEPRITGGIARGIRLDVPVSGTRPSTDFLREAVFSHLANSIEGATVIDLFSGTGAYGLEAISRGASALISVENNAKATKSFQLNATRVCKAMGQASLPITLVMANAFTASIPDSDGPIVVFADPPYDLYEGKTDQLLDICLNCLPEPPEGIVILEHPAAAELSYKSPFLQKTRRLGSKKAHSPAATVFRFGP